MEAEAIADGLVADAGRRHLDARRDEQEERAQDDADERSAAAGVTGIARSLGVAAAPLIAGPLFATAALASAPFVISGGLKIVYDLLLYRSFRRMPPPEERAP